MFTALSFVLEQVKLQGFTSVVIEDASGADRLGYFEGKPNDCAAWLEAAMAQLAGPYVVKAWTEGVRKGGNPGEKKREVVHRWRLYGNYGRAAGDAAPVPVLPAAPAPAPPPVGQSAAEAVAAARMQWELDATRQELAALRAMLDDDDDDEDDDDDDEPEGVTMAGDAASLVGFLRTLFTPGGAPAPAPAPVTGTDAAPSGDLSGDERAILGAFRRARAKDPAQVAEYVRQFVALYPPEANGQQ